MTIKVAINGYGRIGRHILRALYEAKSKYNIHIVAINSLATLTTNVHLTRYDTTHGRFAGDVYTEGDQLVVNGDCIKVHQHRDPSHIPWHDVDVVFECTGAFTTHKQASQHIQAGAKKVLISAPSKDADKTVVYGVNHNLLTQDDRIVSNASCTTNCLAPIVKPLHKQLTLVSGLVNTIHAYTNDQVLVDSNHQDLRRGRAAMQSIIPTKTGAASAVGLVLPELKGKLDGFATRVPVLNVSAVDLTFKAGRATDVAEVNQIMRTAADGHVIAINDEPLVSIDFNHHPASAIFDTTQTKVIDDLVKVVAWYDNEWGFCNRMLDIVTVWP